MPARPQSYRAPHQPAPAETAAAYEARRGSAAERGYDRRWARASRAFLARQPWCVGCAAAGRFIAAEVVDHIVPHRGDAQRFWDEANWQGACRWHHDVVKQRLEAMHTCRADLRLDGAAAIALTALLGRAGG